MEFVNLTNRFVCGKYCRALPPGSISAGGRTVNSLMGTLKSVADSCGDSIGIRLSKSELSVINRLLELDSRGSGFDPNSISAELRNDPWGEKRALEREINARKEAEKRKEEAVEKAIRRDRYISEEVLPRGFHTANTEGEPFNPSELKSGFDDIRAENERIMANKKANPVDPMKAARPVVQATEDITPKIADLENATSMDKQARSIMEQLSTFGPATTKQAEGPEAPEVDEAPKTPEIPEVPAAPKEAGEGAQAKPRGRRGRNKSK